jgi:N-carbamoyl-L-amino-acid hydrolase
MIDRREFLRALAAASTVVAASRFELAQGTGPGLRVNANRLRESLEGLSVFGRPAGGSFADGVSRSGFSDAAVAGRNYVMQLMRSFGLGPRIDAAGNIFGSTAGSDPALKPILFGSHIDSVLSGGNFDGDVGSMSAVEVLHTLKEQGVTPRHPLQMVIWTDEENTFAGSGAAAGLLSAPTSNA